MIYTDSTLQPIYDGQIYIGRDGTQYPSNFPKADIEGLFLVTETAPPINKNILGFIIDNTYTQVWNYRDYTQQESDNIANNIIKSQISALESQQTPRRIRESFSDPSWMNNINAQIEILRGKIIT